MVEEYKDPWRPRLLARPGQTAAPEWLVFSGAKAGDAVKLSGGQVDQHPVLLSSST